MAASSTRRRRRHHRRGATLVWVALSMIMLLGMSAIAIDVGLIYATHADLQAAADASALAGAEGLTVGPALARERALEYAAKNSANGAPVALEPTDIELGIWNPVSRVFTVIGDGETDIVQPDAVRVSPKLIEGRGTAVGNAFARVFGFDTTDVGASATAWYRARDIMLVLDLSASMNDDSELQHIDQLGQTAIEVNLYQIWSQLGAPTFGSMQFDPVYIASGNVQNVMTTLGLNTVPYPYPSGSWSQYIQYVMTNNAVEAAGYQRHYGYLTLVNYWLEMEPGVNETPDLWRTDEQPITAVKDAVSLFFAFLNQVDTNDRVGLGVYTSADGTALEESPLTDNFTYVERLTRERQAGHYQDFTNISAGIRIGREEILENGRAGSFKMIVLLTDGIANRPGNPATARQAALNEAQASADVGLPIITISLGAAADENLMQQIADITDGVHFNVPGGSSIAELEDDLNEVFQQIAGHRPLRLVD